MAATPSTMLDLGTPIPDFTLPNVYGGTYSTSDFQNKALVVMFICNHCPYVLHLERALIEAAKSYQPRKVDFVAISSNDVEKYPQDAPEKMAEKDYPFPYLYDESQEVAKAYKAACTPDFFVFDENRKLVYRGQFDDSRPKNDKEITGRDLKNALDAVLNDEKVPDLQIPSIGCNIKWKPGNEPDYFGKP